MSATPDTAPQVAPAVPLFCRVTASTTPRCVEVDLVPNLETTPEGCMATLTVVLPHGTMTLWFRPEELSALLLELAELHDLQAVAP